MDAPKNLMLSLNQALEQAQVDPQLVSLIDSITTTCKNIAERLRGGALSGLYGSAEQENVQGEVQKKLDVISNDLLKQVLLANRSVAGIASEEEEDAIAGCLSPAAWRLLAGEDPDPEEAELRSPEDRPRASFERQGDHGVHSG
mgnify:CR=1 FL=1